MESSSRRRGGGRRGSESSASDVDCVDGRRRSGSGRDHHEGRLPHSSSTVGTDDEEDVEEYPVPDQYEEPTDVCVLQGNWLQRRLPRETDCCRCCFIF